MSNSIIAIAVGGSLGCLLRWFLSITLNSLFPSISARHFGRQPHRELSDRCLYSVSQQPSEACSRVETVDHHGLSRGLTTFSTFSAEVVTLLQQGRHLRASGAISVHVRGALVMTQRHQLAGRLRLA